MPAQVAPVVCDVQYSLAPATISWWLCGATAADGSFCCRLLTEHDAIVTSVPPSTRTYGWSLILTSPTAPTAGVPGNPGTQSARAVQPNMTELRNVRRMSEPPVPVDIHTALEPQGRYAEWGARRIARSWEHSFP